MPELTELGLRGLATPVLPPVPPPAARITTPTLPDDRYAGTVILFLDRLMEVLGQMAPETDAGQLEDFQGRLSKYREALSDPDHRTSLERIAEDCISTSRHYLEHSRRYQSDREKELNEVISILRDAAQMTVGDSATFHAQVLASTERISAIAALNDIRDLKRRIGDEVGSIRRAVAEKQKTDEVAYAQLSSRVEILQKKLSDMEVEASMDPLTCVGNRRRFQLSLTKMVAQAQQTAAPLSLAMLDVDHFKTVNDVHGHPIGDRVLLAVAQKLAKAVRQTDVLARYGGEEFALLLANVSATDVELRMKQLLADIAASPYEYEAMGRRERVSYTVSCGLTELIHGENEDEFVKRADEALYEAKKRGRNRVVTRKQSLTGRVLSW